MCINPSKLPDGTEFGCRKCWQCRENKIQDWVGRCIAQSKTNPHTYSITMTYGGGDHERATVLTYSDVQKYFKRLRKHGFKFKYLVAGEYGTRKGRAHWHAIMFFDGPAPAHELRRMFNDPHWGHGHSMWDKPSAKAVRYVCKYVLKDESDKGAQAHFAMSKKPPIGSEYFAAMAQSLVDQELSPRDLKYSFDENRDKDGNKVQHYMHGATARDFCWEFIDRWIDTYGHDRWPNSPLIDGNNKQLGFLDKQEPLTYHWFRGIEVPTINHYGDTFRYLPFDKKGMHLWQDEQGKVAPWETASLLRHLGLEPLTPSPEPIPQTPQAVCGTRPERPLSRVLELRARRSLAKRLPMVGDPWSPLEPNSP